MRCGNEEVATEPCHELVGGQAAGTRRFRPDEFGGANRSSRSSRSSRAARAARRSGAACTTGTGYPVR